MTELYDILVVRWFHVCVQVQALCKQKLAEVSDALYSLSRRPDPRVWFYRACSIQGVTYSTVERDKSRCTQNSGVMSPSHHEGEPLDFYGVLREVIKLVYPGHDRTVVLLRCDWYNQDGKSGGKSEGISNDGHYKSINITSLWYKDDPFILATQARKIFYMEDTRLGKEWRVVQKFESRDAFDVNEIIEGSEDEYDFDMSGDMSADDDEF